MTNPNFDRIEAEQNELRVKELRAKIKRQAEQITRLEQSRKNIKGWNRNLKTEQCRLRHALNVLCIAGDLKLGHVYGEIQSLWDARETVIAFLKEEGK